MTRRTGKPGTDSAPVEVDELRELLQPTLEAPSEAKLAEVWRAWHKLPADLLPEERKSILLATLAEDARHPLERDALKKLRANSGFHHFEPFDRAKYELTLDQAERWAVLQRSHRTTLERHLDRIQTRQWAFYEADWQAIGRIAVWRAAREIEITGPDRLTSSTPTLKGIDRAWKRCKAYGDARAAALGELEAVAQKHPVIRAAQEQRESRRRELRGERNRLLNELEVQAGGPATEAIQQAFASWPAARQTDYEAKVDELRRLTPPQPYWNLPKHLFFARLDALGIVAAEQLRLFISCELPRLPRAERQEFYLVSLNPRAGKSDGSAALRVWLLDNNPIFDVFGWTKYDIRRAARLRDIPVPASDVELGKQCLRWGITLKLRDDVGSMSNLDHQEQLRNSTPLLTPRPAFGDILR